MPLTDIYMSGTGVLVEFEDRPTRVLRAGWGTVVEQPAGTANWFHYVPTVPVNGLHDRATMQHSLAWVDTRADLSGARISDLHIRQGERLVFDLTDTSRLPIASERADIRMPSERETFGRGAFSSTHLPGYGGFVLCIRVDFTGGDNRIIFRDAGFGFNL